MVLTGVGVRLDLVGPRPVAPPHSLLNTAGVVVDRDEGRWLNGVNIVGYPDDTPSLWEPCSEGTFRTKGEGTGRPQETFDPFIVYLPAICSTFGYFDLQEQAQAVLEATESMGVEEALSQGITGSANPFFGDGGAAILAGAAAQSPGVALSYLEQAIGATGRQGMIHATPAVVAALEAFPVGGAAGDLVTANGTRVVSGDGYQDAVPAGQAAPGATEDWIFATGPVEVRLGDVFVTELAESLDRSDNTVVFRAERPVLATWDTALQAAILVDWSS